MWTTECWMERSGQTMNIHKSDKGIHRHTVIIQSFQTNSADPDQTAPRGAV